MASTLSAATQALAISAVRSFIGWAAIFDSFPHLNLDAARRALRIPTVQNISIPAALADDDVQPLLSAAETATGTRAMIAVFLGAGLREAELCALDCSDVIEDAGAGVSVLRVRGKGGKHRLVPVRAPLCWQPHCSISGTFVG